MAVLNPTLGLGLVVPDPSSTTRPPRKKGQAIFHGTNGFGSARAVWRSNVAKLLRRQRQQRAASAGAEAGSVEHRPE